MAPQYVVESVAKFQSNTMKKKLFKLWSPHFYVYLQTFHIKRIKSQHLNVSHLLQGVKSM